MQGRSSPVRGHAPRGQGQERLASSVAVMESLAREASDVLRDRIGCIDRLSGSERVAAILEVVLLKAVVSRENLRHRLRKAAHDVNKGNLDLREPREAAEVSAMAFDVRTAGIRVVELLSSWHAAVAMAARGPSLTMPGPTDPTPEAVPFVFAGVDYSLKMLSDLDFLSARRSLPSS